MTDIHFVACIANGGHLVWERFKTVAFWWSKHESNSGVARVILHTRNEPGCFDIIVLEELEEAGYADLASKHTLHGAPVWI